jgi:membrane fusion protein (multidrug efflux system)
MAIAAILLIAFIVFQKEILGAENKPAKEEEVDPPPSTDNGAAPGSIPVEAFIATSESLRDNIVVSGSTVPNEEVVITTEVPGKIEQITFTEGANVSRGATLVRLDKSELMAERERLQVQRNLNQKIAERLKALYDKEGVSLQEYEVAEAETEKVDAEIALIDAQLEKRTIKAPFSGRLGLRMASEGSYISPGIPIVSLVSTNPIKLEFNVPEKYANSLTTGTTIQFQLDGTNKSFNAKVIAREPNVDPDTRTLKLKAAAPNPGGSILPGSFAKVTVNINEYGEAILIPTQALMPKLNTNNVYILNNGKVELVEVNTGIREENRVQVTSGIEVGDTIITTGLLQLSPGDAVRISKLKNT